MGHSLGSCALFDLLDHQHSPSSKPPPAPTEQTRLKLLHFTTFSCILYIVISIINHTLWSMIKAVISTLTCNSMATNSTSDSERY